jgi:dTDP-4-amino-4,6-dideoxygalactose transaminase
MSDIHITKTFLPPLEEYQEYLRTIWESRQVTNNGPLSIKLEDQLASYLDIPHLQWLSNGTTSLQIAIQVLELKGKILTTPFTYIATATSIIWENCRPVFVDIHPDTLSMDPAKLEEQIDEQTSAVLAVHVYGYPCDVEAIDTICKKHGLKLIYDAAHAFGVRYKGRSILSYGDLSVLSFHATKVYHTIEGGAIATENEDWAEKVSLFKTFGHVYDEYKQVGINGKNTEFHAAIGLLNLNYIDQLIAERKERFDHYQHLLRDSSIRMLHPSDYDTLEYNYGYMVVIFEHEAELQRVSDALEEQNIHPRRYFKPALNTLQYLNESSCPVAEKIASSILCLPLYHDLAEQDIERIAQIVKENC